MSAGAERQNDDDRYDELLAACDEAIASGATPPVPEDVDDSTQMKPRLERGLACLQLLNALRPLGAPDRPDHLTWITPEDRSRPAALPEKLGRFLVRRELGRGGFGVVFLAYDPKLRRDVALKVPHPDMLATTTLRRRFQREAHSAAALDHPNLVPVFECDEIGPLCYIASAYCPGPNLADCLKNRTEPVPARTAAAISAALADALQHAHSRGVLHRDLKPSNVLLAPVESQERSRDALEFIPRVTDFGMARSVDPPVAAAGEDAEADPLTKSGVIVGTPRYMSPEQAAGKSSAISPQTDVYGLGVILYELLTGHPPFLAESALETLQRVQCDEPVSPGRLRPRLPRDVETICLTCLRKEPHRRYASAGALAEDLRRFLAGKPIMARPVGRGERTWRWCRREPRFASLLALLFTTIVGGFAGILWQWLRAEGHARLARTERDSAKLERVHAESNFRKARAVVDRLAQLAEDLRHQPRLSKTRRLVLAEVSTFYQGFVAEKSTDPVVRFEAATICNRLAELYNWLGQRDEEKEAVRRGSELLDGLMVQYPDNLSYRHQRSVNYLRSGHAFRALGQMKEAGEPYKAAVDLSERLIAERPDRLDYRSHMAGVLMNWANTRYNLGQLNDARPAYERAIAMQRELVEDAPQEHFFRSELGVGLNDLSLLLWAERKPAESEAACRDSLKILEELCRDQKVLSWDRELLARSQSRLALILATTGRLDAAEVAYRAAIATIESLVADFPEGPQARLQLVSTYAELAAMLRRVAGRERAVEAALKKSAEICGALVKDFPEVKDYRQRFAARQAALGSALTRSELYAVATRAFEDGLAAMPDDPLLNNNLAWLLVTSRLAEFRDASRAVKLAGKATSGRPQLGDYWNTLGIAHYRAGNLPDSLAAFDKSMQFRQGGDANDWFFLAMVRAKMGEAGQARAWFDKAAAWTAQKHPDDADLRSFRAEAEALMSGAPQPSPSGG